MIHRLKRLPGTLHFLFWLPLTLLLAAGTLSTKAAGFAWLWLILAGLLAWWQSRHPEGRVGSVGSVGSVGNVGAASAKAPASGEAIAASVAKIWLITTAAALLLKTVPMLYWSDPWEERHAELRLLFGALGLYGLCQLPLERLHKTYLDSKYVAAVGSALAVACALALWLVLVQGSNAAPTNRIPWAGGVAILTCTLLALSQVTSNLRLRCLWLAASVAGLLAVLASDVRGAYGVALAWPVLAIYFLTVKPTVMATRHWMKYALLAVAAPLLVVVFAQSSFLQKPLQRIELAWAESSMASSAQGVNTSVGARLYMWRQGLEAIKESPWMGHGREGRIAHIRQWGQEGNSSTVSGLGHLHNDYLQTLMDHGIWGLLSLLSYGVGMLLMARKLMTSHKVAHEVQHKALAAGLASVVFMMFSSSLSNMNFAHNYYPTVLSLAVTLLVLAAACSSSPEDPRL